jgi:UDP-N-acetylmuramoyl-tripeptide--D-alanyl-D-alanine ligase
MKPLILDEVIAAIGGKPVGTPPPVRVTGVSTDSRTITPDSLFFALRGEQFDGHEYVAQALIAGAVAAVISDPGAITSDLPPRAILIQVKDTAQALSDLARFHRRQLAAQVIAVTGSNGKTTTKMMIDHVLAGRFKGRASIKSYNNHIGVPLTLLSAAGDDEYLVVEIGTNAPGEVAALAKLTAPDIAVITSVAGVHLEGLRDLQGVAQEKASLLDHVRQGGFAAVNADEPLLEDELPTSPKFKLIRYGHRSDADLRLTDVAVEPEGLRFKINGRFDVSLPVMGRHNALNILAAVAVGRRFGLADDEIIERLKNFSLPSMRLQRETHSGVTFINDAYNANPASMEAAVDVLDEMALTGRRILVLGDMRELGEQTDRYHEHLGRHVGQRKADYLVAVGVQAERVTAAARLGRPTLKTWCYPDSDGAGRAIINLTHPGDVVLVKGSRLLKMERVVDHFRRHAERTDALTTADA